MIDANGHTMSQQEVLIHAPTAPGEEEETRLMWVCDEDCGEIEPIINEGEDPREE